MKKLVFTAIIIVGSISFVSAQESFTLTVEIEGVKNNEGVLKLGIFNNEEDYLNNPVIAQDIDLSKEDVHVFKIEGIAPGEYALSVIHDENESGELDMGPMGPTEAYGFSNNARGMFGPAKYKDTVMKIDKDITTTIKIR